MLLIGWQTQTQAFFCFTFGGQARHDSRLDARAWQPPPPPPPQLLSPYLSMQTLRTPVETGADLPPIRKAKQSPEIIQGYRFRPLDRKRQEPIPPRDWRD
jgi:hypothetical protein